MSEYAVDDDNKVTFSSVAWFIVWLSLSGMNSVYFSSVEDDDPCGKFSAGIAASSVGIGIFWVVRSRGLPKWFCTGIASGAVSLTFIYASECSEASPIIGGVISVIVMSVVGLCSCGGEVEEDWDNCAKARALVFGAISLRLADGTIDGSVAGPMLFITFVGMASPRFGMGLMVGYDFLAAALSVTDNLWQAFAGLSVIAALLIKMGSEESESGPILVQ